jgi:hypothetical protein
MKSKIENIDWKMMAIKWHFPPKKVKKDGDIETFTNINRLEVINHSNQGTVGRVFNFRGKDLTIECQLQDGTETLKVFISK